MAKYSLVILLTFSHVVFADYKFGFGSVSLNHLNWTTGTERKSTKRDFQYAEIEGGGVYSWGELYGFFDYENPGKKGSEVRSAAKGNLHAKTGLAGLTLYAHLYNFGADGFYEQNRVFGLGYLFAGDGWWVKPFLGLHDVSQSFYSGPNGYMAGWVIGYSFKLLNQSFMFSDWTEYEFGRAERYAAGNGGSKTSHNGAAAIWWNIWKTSLGVQWRYATSKLGTPGTMGAWIYTLKYNF